MSVLYLPGAPTDLQAAAMALRGRGLTYERIGQELGVRRGDAWWLVKRGREAVRARPAWVTRCAGRVS